jgi:RNA polymerase sigma factor (sigma-70 family)
MIRGIAEGTNGQGTSTAVSGPTDEELLAQFLDGEGAASEDAFQALVGRHGPRVLRICRHVLEREHDAEDAFQATFLVLARNGASIRDRCALAGWLQEVAYRTALKTRARRSRRRMVEKEVRVLAPPRNEPDDQGERAVLSELRPVLHEEVTGLPDKYRIPVVLSYLEGKTNEEVAALLKWPIGTVKGRLSRGRALLRSRLTRRGVALSVGSLLCALRGSQVEAADVPADLLRRTTRRALRPRPLSPASQPASSPAQPPAGDIPPGEPALSAPPDAVPSPRSTVRNPRRVRWDQFSAAGALLFAFLISVLLGGFVSATTYGGGFPNLRTAFAGFKPSWWRPVKAHHHRTTSVTVPGGVRPLNLDRTSIYAGDAGGDLPHCEDR